MTTERASWRSAITAVVLAGGQARRMGGADKGLVEIHGQSMVEYVVDALRAQVGVLLVNANRNLDLYAKLSGSQVITDDIEGYAGPLAGIASAMACCDTPYLMSVPCDSPLLSPDLAERLHAALRAEDAELSVAHDGERLQPVFALMRRDLLASLTRYLDSGERKIDRWYARHRAAVADMADTPHMFLNVNTPDERDRLESLMPEPQGRTECC